MEPDSKILSEQECIDEVKLMARRTALLFSSFAATLIEELGEEEGQRLIKKAIWGYGKYCGRAIRVEVEKRGLPLSDENFRLIPDLHHPVPGVFRISICPASQGSGAATHKAY